MLLISGCSSGGNPTMTADPLDDLYRITATATGYQETWIHTLDGDRFYRVCSYTSCSYSDLTEPTNPIIATRRLLGESESSGPVGEPIQGVQFWSDSPDTDTWQTYGAWLEHSAFSGEINQDGVIIVHRYYGQRIQDKEFTLPEGETAHYRGAVAGIRLASSEHFSGSADIGIALDPLDVTIDFTELQFPVTGETLPDIALHDDIPISLNSDLNFLLGFDGQFFDTSEKYMLADFFGPDHAELTGYFGLPEVIGSFGTRKVSGESETD